MTNHRMHTLELSLGILLTAIPLGAHAQGAPALLPVQGLLTDAQGARISGPTDVTFSLYAAETGGAALHTETQNVDVDSGLFTAYVGSDPNNALDLAIFLSDSVYLGITVGADPEMSPRFRLASAPYAGFAQYCGDASTLQGAVAGDFATAAHTHAFGDLTAIPADIADGDDGFTTEAQLTALLDNNYLATETDPQVGTLTNGRWCTSNGTTVNCSQTAPVTTEVDPQVGTLTNGRWCTSNGSVITCSQTAPVDTRCDSATCGTVTVGAVNYSAPRTGYVNVNANSFTASVQGYGTATNGNYRYATSPTAAQGSLVAGLTLPHGVTVTDLRCSVYDNAASNVQFLGIIDGLANTWRCLTGATTTGVSTARQEIGSACSFPVNNQTNSYYVRFVVDNAQFGSNLRLYGCRITYTYTSEGR